MKCTPLINSPRNLECLKKHSERERTKEKFPQQKLQEDIVAITSPPSERKNQVIPIDVSLTQESLQKNKKATWKDKLSSLNQSSQPTRSFQTLVQESTSKEKVCSPFWTSLCKENSKMLWLPTKTDCVDLDLKSLNTSSNIPEPLLQSLKILRMIPQMNCQETLSLSLQSSQQGTMEAENTTKTMVTRKMRIYPNKEQKQLFEKCLGVHRYFYNKANAYLKQVSGTEEFKKSLSMISLRKKLLKSDSELTEEELWQKDVPYDTRQLSLKQLVTSYKTSLALKRAGLIKSFNISFLRKKSPRQIFYVDNRALKVIKDNQLHIFTQRLKNKKQLRQRKRDRKKIASFLEGKNESDVVIQKLDCGKWYICLLKEKEKPIYDSPMYKSVFLDPGVRTFQSFYSPEGLCGKIGDDYGVKYIAPLLQKHDLMQSIGKKKKSSLLRTKVKNIVDDLHRKTSKFLCDCFQSIVIPPFETQSMVMIPKNTRRKINSKVARNMMTLSHYRFQQCLRVQANKYQRRVITMNEAYTSKTCGCCGTINDKLGGSKTFNCKNCHLSIDRDLHAARNLCLKTMTGSMVQFP
jgi:putative transposase